MLMNEVNILLVESSTIDFVFPQINHSEPLPGILSGVLPNLRSVAFRSSGGGGIGDLGWLYSSYPKSNSYSIAPSNRLRYWENWL